jgi:hypothetical protein
MADLTEGIWYWRVCARESSTGDWGLECGFLFLRPGARVLRIYPRRWEQHERHNSSPGLGGFSGGIGYEVQYALSDGDLHGAQRETVADSQYSVPQGEAFAFGETCRWGSGRL